MKLKFLGSGSAFNTKLGNTSAYIINGSELILIDCGSTVFKQIIANKLINNDITTINVYVTHTHPDHMGSLGDLIFYCYYNLNITVNVFCVDSNIKNILDNQGCKDHYDFIQLQYDVQRVNKKYKVIPIETKHVDEIISSGFLFEFDDETFYYSGDSYTIPDGILDLFHNNKIDYLFQDVSGLNYDGNPHLYLETLDYLINTNRKKVYCMHLHDTLYKYKELISRYGFNVVQNEFDKNAIYAGSFDPITLGHLDVIKKASKMFDKVIIGVLVNSKKNSLFTLDKRKEQIQRVIEDSKLYNVEVQTFDGLTVDFAKQNNAKYLIRGVRNTIDFEDEQLINSVNKKMSEDIETILLIADEKYKLMSSSLVKELGTNNSDISWLVPEVILSEVQNKF